MRFTFLAIARDLATSLGSSSIACSMLITAEDRIYSYESLRSGIISSVEVFWIGCFTRFVDRNRSTSSSKNAVEPFRYLFSRGLNGFCRSSTYGFVGSASGLWVFNRTLCAFSSYSSKSIPCFYKDFCLKCSASRSSLICGNFYIRLLISVRPTLNLSRLLFFIKPSLGPRNSAPTRPVAPPTKCTTPDPA